MLIDPFMNGFSELHDRHRDMRLDVDNMSYEVIHVLCVMGYIDNTYDRVVEGLRYQ